MLLCRSRFSHLSPPLAGLLLLSAIVAIPEIRTVVAARVSPVGLAFLVACAFGEGFGTTFDSSGLRSI